MANELKQLEDQMKKYAKNAQRLKSLKIDDMRQYIHLLKSRLSTFVNSVNSLPNSVRHNLGIAINKYSSDASKQGVNQYLAYTKLLKGNAERAEKLPLESLRLTSVSMIDILEELNDKLDELFASDNVNMFNAKLSYVVIFNVVEAARQLSYYVLCTFTAITYDIAGGVAPAKYVNETITTKKALIADLVMNVIEKNGVYGFLACIDDIKKANADVLVVDEKGSSSLGFVKENSLQKNTREVLGINILGFDIFRWMGELWTNIVHYFKLLDREDKEWMEAQVALLQLELAETQDLDRKEKLVKIIEKYSEQINKIQQKLDKYFND